jgi:cell division protein FtsZ
MTLGETNDEQKLEVPKPIQQSLPLEDKDPYAPKLNDIQEEIFATQSLDNDPMVYDFSTSTSHSNEEHNEDVKETPILRFELSTEITGEVNIPTTPIASNENTQSLAENNQQTTQNGMLTKPSNIYAEEPEYEKPSQMSGHSMEPTSTTDNNEELPELEMKLVVRSENPEAANEQTVRAQHESFANLSAEEPAMLDDAEEQKRKAAERIQKLRNLPFNVNTASEIGNEFDAVPAYIRRNMELFGNTLASVDSFYSKYTVNKDENDNTQISTINTFLDGKKPD